MKSLILIIATSVAAAPISAQTMPPTRGTTAPSKARTGLGSGVVRAIDAKTAKVTIQHGPIRELAWPGMTMAFVATSPALLRNLSVGQRIDFTVQMRGTTAAVTAIRKR